MNTWKDNKSTITVAIPETMLPNSTVPMLALPTEPSALTAPAAQPEATPQR